MIPLETLIGKGKKKIQLNEANIEETARYSCENANITFQIWKALKPKLNELNLNNIYYEYDLPLIKVLMTMENNGISINTRILESLSKEFENELVQLETKIYNQAGTTFNLRSPIQMSEVLFEKLKLKNYKKTKTGYSTDANVLEKLKNDHPIISMIVDYREISKLKSTYSDVLPKLISSKTNKLHTSYSQTIAATGRLSSLHPNLQNIPIRSHYGKKIRSAFVSAENHILLSADYSQIELRILAHLSQDKELLNAYQNNLDIHTQTASAIYQVKEDAITDTMRRNAKIINFGVIYGMGAKKLSHEIKISVAEAKQFIQNYFEKYYGIKQFIEDKKNEVRHQGFVSTLTGRKRFLPDISSNNPMIRENAERMAVNTSIQGTASDLIKIAMIRIHNRIKNENQSIKMLLQVHDELIFELKKDKVDFYSSIIKEEMQDAMTLDIPIEVNIATGENWLDAH